MEPVIKWAGGKRQLLPILSAQFPKKFHAYYEPLLGGGAALFSLQPKIARAADINAKLITVYDVVKNQLKELVNHLGNFQAVVHSIGWSDQYYYHIRDKFNQAQTPLEVAATFIFLNKTCFNGLYRENKKGEFNVPFGKYKNPKIFDFANLTAMSDYLNKNDVIITSDDYTKCTSTAGKDDFVYFDPPYYPFNRESFTSYTKDAFLEKEHEGLFAEFCRLDKLGCKVLLSNSNTPFIRKLYKGYDLTTVAAKRAISSKGSTRHKANLELLIKNY
jgi:DNA adenine methylase